MNKFISDLYDYICEHTPSLRNDPEYQCAEGAYSHLWALAVFRQSLRLSCRFMLEMLR